MAVVAMSRRPAIDWLKFELVVFEHPTAGRVAALVPVVPEDAPYALREGVARRRLLSLTGECPCGAESDLPAPPAVAEFMVKEIDHEARCPAIDKKLEKAIRRWQR